MYPKGKNQPGQRCLRSGRSLKNLEIGKQLSKYTRCLNGTDFASNLCKIWGDAGPPAPGVVPPALCLQNAIGVGARLQVKSQIRRNILWKTFSVFIPLRVFRHIHTYEYVLLLRLFSFEYGRVWTPWLQRNSTSYFDYSRKSLACVQSNCSGLAIAAKMVFKPPNYAPLWLFQKT